jgi:uncharacterized protein YbjT (DUF2867 family)
MQQNPRAVTITGGTGYVGRPLIEQLIGRGFDVTALARSGSRSRVPAGANVVEGSALAADDVARALSAGCTLVLLVGTPHPSPAKAKQFQEVDLVSVRAAAEALARVRAAHVVYVSVAHPAPMMQAYIDVRSEGERLLAATGVPLTVLRPWYVLGPGHWWPYALVPFYWLFERIPSKRETALRLGLVTHDQMLAALVRAVEDPLPAGVRIVGVPEIRKGP